MENVNQMHFLYDSHTRWSMSQVNPPQKIYVKWRKIVLINCCSFFDFFRTISLTLTT